MRGLIAIPFPSGKGEVLLAAVEGSAARIVRVGPRDGDEATEIDLPDFLRWQWGMPAGYVMAAYNDMASIRDPAGGGALVIGLEAFFPLAGRGCGGAQRRAGRIRPPRSRRLVFGAPC